MKFRRSPTRVQWIMLVGLFLVLLGLVIIAIPEIAGILSPELEDTLSEWAWDMPAPVVFGLSLASIIVAIIIAWFSIHLWEGWIRRRRIERRSKD